MSILVTGAFGFVGSNLSKALKTASELHLIAIDIIEPTNHIFDEYYSWNNLSKINWNSIDIIIHLAGKAHDTKNTSEQKAYFEINVGLTKKIFDHFLKSSAQKFIFFSSVKAIADNVIGEYITEEEIPNPQNPYGKSKLEAEKYILDQTLLKEKRVYVLRPSMIHGPGNKGNLNLLYKLAQKGMPWPLGAYKNKRSFTSFDNLAFVIDQIIKNDIEQGIYQISDDEALSTNEIIRLISASQNRNAKIWNIPRKLMRIAAKIGDLLHLPLNSERLKKLTESYVVSNAKLKKAIGIDKMPISAEEGLKKTLASFSAPLAGTTNH